MDEESPFPELKRQHKLIKSFYEFVSQDKIKDAYKIFKKYAPVILSYFKCEGEEAIQSLLEKTREQLPFGFFAAQRMNLTLDNLLKADEKRVEKSIKKLKELNKALEIQARKENYVSKKVMDIEFNV